MTNSSFDHAEIAGDQREQIGRFRERIVPDGVVPAVGEVADLSTGCRWRAAAALRVSRASMRTV